MDHTLTEENRPQDGILIQEASLQSARIHLDENVKRLLAQKSVLAWILQRNVREFRDMELQDIIPCIEGEPEVGSRPVNPGETNTEIRDAGREDSVPGEGTLFFDILFSVKVPHDDGYIKMIINVEAQEDFYPGYHLENRALFYAAREISSQKHTEFENSDYDSIKKVYSIWLCMDAPAKNGNAIAVYSIGKQDLLPGIPDHRELYDKMTYVLVTLNQKLRSGDPFIGFMNLLLSEHIEPKEKKERLEKEFGIHVGYEMKERMDVMCNYSAMVERHGIEQGMQQGTEQGKAQGIQIGRILAHYEDGIMPKDIAKKMNIGLEQIEEVLTQNGVFGNQPEGV